MKRLTLSLCLALSCAYLFGQQVLPIPKEVETAISKGTRSLSGRPGKKYWQNTANYDLKVNFNPLSRVVSGTAEITYVNNSPDTLNQMWFKLYPNLYKKGVSVKSRIAASDQGEGILLSGLKIGEQSIDSSGYVIDGTNMHANINALVPGKSVKISVKYAYILNKGSHTRTGQVDEGSAFIAYFFPRVAVYDDIDGWNKYPYTGDAEFYNDFCDFKAEVTVPDKYVVWATGDLLNADKVFNSSVAGRLQLAEKSDSVVNVITAADVENKTVTSGQPFNTYKFEAKHVTDFVFATSNHYLWKSTSLVVDPATSRRTRVDAAFNPIHKDYYEVIDFARKSVQAMSYDFPKWPYPYAHETVFDGLDQMEYPMMVNDNPVKNREDAITLTVHEIFHTMFPFYMGINETKYGWMDEGWATIGEWTIGPMIDSNMVDLYGVEATAATSGRKDDSPIVTLTPELKGAAAFTNSYPKPGMGYLFVRDYLGDELFTKALHHYIELWQGKHPTPTDFFNSMNEGAGKNMNWFWKRWFFEDGITDLGISNVVKTKSGYTISIANNGPKPLPVDLSLNFADGSKARLHRTIGVWENDEKVIAVELKSKKKLIKVTLGGAHTPDKNKTDNIKTL
jgi:hypothetical protein